MNEGVVYLITAEAIGSGSEELGKILMRSFLINLAEAEAVPKALVFMNAGVRLTCEGSELAAAIRSIAERGTGVFSCGTCLDYFNLKDQLVCGEVGGMAKFVELFGSHPTVTIG